jgi:hypothetical protein
MLSAANSRARLEVMDAAGQPIELHAGDNVERPPARHLTEGDQAPGAGLWPR